MATLSRGRGFESRSSHGCASTFLLCYVALFHVGRGLAMDCSPCKVFYQSKGVTISELILYGNSLKDEEFFIRSPFS